MHNLYYLRVIDIQINLYGFERTLFLPSPTTNYATNTGSSNASAQGDVTTRIAASERAESLSDSIAVFQKCIISYLQYIPKILKLMLLKFRVYFNI